MFVARWQIDARFGHKQAVIDLMRRWEREIGQLAGLAETEMEMLTGSIGAREATVENNVRVASLTELDGFFAKLGDIPDHARWGSDMEPHVVSGSSRWTVLRVLKA